MADGLDNQSELILDGTESSELIDFLNTEGATREMARIIEESIRASIGTGSKAHRDFLDLREEGGIASDSQILPWLAAGYRADAIIGMNPDLKTDRNVLSAMRTYGDAFALKILRPLLAVPRGRHEDVRDTGISKPGTKKIYEIDPCPTDGERLYEMGRRSVMPAPEIAERMALERKVVRDYLAGTGVFEKKAAVKKRKSKK